MLIPALNPGKLDETRWELTAKGLIMPLIIIYGLFLLILALFFVTFPESEKTNWNTTLVVVCVLSGIVFLAHGVMMIGQA